MHRDLHQHSVTQEDHNLHMYETAIYWLRTSMLNMGDSPKLHTLLKAPLSLKHTLSRLNKKDGV